VGRFWLSPRFLLLQVYFLYYYLEPCSSEFGILGVPLVCFLATTLILPTFELAGIAYFVQYYFPALV
jgi:hypothetical protein